MLQEAARAASYDGKMDEKWRCSTVYVHV